MTSFSDLFDHSEFEAMVDAGYVRVQDHPTLPLHIVNYSEKAQFDRVWNRVTLTCRGLIFDDAWTVIARPYRKFFNYGDDANTGELNLSAQAVVTDKLDGSLGICYPTPDGPAIATRGSFTSDQALHATEVLRDRYGHWQPDPGYTHLYEIIYPQNRIVVDYDGLDDLVLHGAVNLETGHVHPAASVLNWPGPMVTQFAYESLAEALAADPRPNAEGFVALLDGQQMIKVKQEDYVALHRIVTGLNARTVWEWIGDGKTVAELCATIPDDFHAWVTGVAADLTAASDGILETATAAHVATLRLLPADHTRGDYARAVSGYGCKPYMFLLLDGRDEMARALAWRSVKPSGAWSLIHHSEAVA